LHYCMSSSPFSSTLCLGQAAPAPDLTPSLPQTPAPFSLVWPRTHLAVPGCVAAFKLIRVREPSGPSEWVLQCDPRLCEKVDLSDVEPPWPFFFIWTFLSVERLLCPCSLFMPTFPIRCPAEFSTAPFFSRGDVTHAACLFSRFFFFHSPLLLRFFFFSRFRTLGNSNLATRCATSFSRFVALHFACRTQE